MNRIIRKETPDFHLKVASGDGEDSIDVDLDTYRGHWLVLFFYPIDFTFVCPTEFASLSNDLHLFEDANARLLTVSTDSGHTHQAWIRNGLGRTRYPLGAGKTLSMSAGYGVLLRGQDVTLRGLFIIDPDQITCYSVTRDSNTSRNTQEVLHVLKALQTGSLCRANWTTGSRPLKKGGNALPGAFSTDQAVRIYTLPGYSYCHQVKEFLSGNGTPLEEINLKSDAKGQAFMDNQDCTVLPVTVVGNNEISGFRLDKIRGPLL